MFLKFFVVLFMYFYCSSGEICGLHEFDCDNHKKCISFERHCDGKEDCVDKSDESSCGKR